MNDGPHQPILNLVRRPPKKGFIMRLVVVSLSALLVLTTGGVAVSAQDASPASTPSRLADLGYPELRIVVTDAGAEVPQEVAAGRLLVVLENQGTADGPAAVSDVNLLQVPEGVTLDELNALYAAEAVEVPDWFSHIISVGGFNVVAGQTGYAVIDLAPGEWFIGVGDFNPYTALTVTADANGTAIPDSDPPADLDIGLSDFSYDMPDRFPVGPQVWHVTNSGQQLHEIVLVRTPELITVEQVMAIIQLPEGGTPPPGVPDMATFEFLPDVVKPLSAGREIWVEPNLSPGYYVAICSTADPETGQPHTLLGEIHVFIVGDQATPTG